MFLGLIPFCVPFLAFSCSSLVCNIFFFEFVTSFVVLPVGWVEFIQRIVDSFWKRWARDVFPTLIPRKRWHTERRNVRVGDVAVLSDENKVIRGRWTICRVIEVYPGPDGRVRNVKVKTAESEYQRPITKIAVIYPAEGYED